MLEWKRNSKLTPTQLDDVARFVASFATIPSEMTADDWLSSPGVSDHPGMAPFEKECGTCHVIDGWTEGGLRDAPKLFGWGSLHWTRRLIHNPAASDLYGYLDPKDRMPAFGPDQLTENDLETVIRYLKHDHPGRATPSVARSR